MCAFLKDLNTRLDGDPELVMDEAELAYIDRALAAGWNTATAKYGADPDRWLESFRLSTATLALPYGTNLEGFPSLDRSLDVVSAPLSDPEGSTIWAQRGNSYSQWIDLSNVDAALALLPLGISEDPESDFYSVEKALWESGDLRAAPLDREAVEAMAEAAITLQYEPGD